MPDQATPQDQRSPPARMRAGTEGEGEEVRRAGPSPRARGAAGNADVTETRFSQTAGHVRPSAPPATTRKSGRFRRFLGSPDSTWPRLPPTVSTRHARSEDRSRPDGPTVVRRRDLQPQVANGSIPARAGNPLATHRWPAPFLRSIPARAGNPKARLKSSQPADIHPRARGEPLARWDFIEVHPRARGEPPSGSTESRP